MNRLEDKKYPCIYTLKRNGKIYRYIVKLTVNHERRYVGCYKTEKEAILAYRSYVKRMNLGGIHNEFKL